MLKLNSKTRIILHISLNLLLFITFFGLTVHRFWGYRNSKFAMDDPYLLQFFLDSTKTSFEKVFEEIASNRWRPVADLAYLIASKFSGENFSRWWLINILVLTISAVVLFYVLKTLSKSIVLSILLTYVFICSRFLLYQVVTATGLIEALATLFFVIYLWAVIKVMRKTKLLSLFLLFIATFSLILTHERFQLVAIISIFIILQLETISTKAKIMWAFSMTMPVLLLLAVKILIFKMPLFVGTGSATDLGFSWEGAITHLAESIANLGGITLGPDYLVGITFTSSSAIIQLISIVLFAVSSFLVLLSVILFQQNTYKKRNWKTGLIFIGLMIFLLIPIIVTIRLEQRWLVTPYVLLLLAVSVSWRYVQKLSNPNAAFLLILTVLFVGLSLQLEASSKQGESNVFFVQHQQSAEKLLTNLAPALAEASIDGCQVGISNNESIPGLQEEISRIVEANTSFSSQDFEVYEPGSAKDLYCKDKHFQFDTANGLHMKSG